MPRLFSGRAISNILSNKYGFKEVRVVGSHLKMRKTSSSKVITVIIPLHQEVSIGTFHSILRQVGIDKKDFMEKSRE